MTNEQKLTKRMEVLERQVDNLQKHAYQETGTGGRLYDPEVVAAISQAETEIGWIDEQLYKIQQK